MENILGADAPASPPRGAAQAKRAVSRKFGEAIFALSYALFFAYFFRLGRRYIFDRDLLHASILLQWLGAWAGGRRLGGPAVLRGLASLGANPRALVTFFTAWIAFGAWLSITRNHGIFPDGDFSIYAQTIHSLGTGHGYWTSLAYSGKPSFLTDHQSYALALLAPAFWSSRGIEILFAAQATALYLPGLALALDYRRRARSPELAGLIAAVWIFFVGSFHNLTWEFHETTLSVPLLALWAWALMERRPAVFLLASLACGLVKEQLLLLTLPGVLFFIWRERGRRAWVAGAMATLLVQLALFSLNQRIFSGVDYLALRYGQFGRRAPEILRNVLLRPDLVATSVFTKAKIDFLLHLLFASGLGALGAGWLTLAWLPFFGLHALSQHAPQTSMDYHYVLEIWAVLAVVAIAGLRKFAARPGARGALALTAIAWMANPNELLWKAQEVAAQSRGCAEVRTRLRAQLLADWDARGCASEERASLADAELFPQIPDLGRAYRLTEGNALDEFSRARCRSVIFNSAREDARALAQPYLRGLTPQPPLRGCREMEIELYVSRP